MLSRIEPFSGARVDQITSYINGFGVGVLTACAPARQPGVLVRRRRFPPNYANYSSNINGSASGAIGRSII